MIIGVTGFIGSGKDTIANYLVAKHGFVRDSFAGTLKDAVAQVFGWDRELLEGLTPEAREWVLDRLSGRFATMAHPFDYLANSFPNVRIAFEDPKEAVFYELTWS